MKSFSGIDPSLSLCPTSFNRDDEALRLLADASRLLVNCTNYEATLEMVAKLLVSSLATWCSIDLVTKDKKIERVAVTHRDPSKAEQARQMMVRYPARPTAKRGVYRVIETGKSILIAETNRESWALRADDSEHLDLIMELGSTTYMCIPLIARGRVVGSIMLLSGERTYDEKDLQTAEELAICIALAVDNVQMFRDMQNAVKVRDEFLAILSHELRTPLNVIQGWINLLKSDNLNEIAMNEALDVLDRNSLLQARMINDILDVSRISVGKLVMNKGRIDLIEVIRSAVESAQLEASKKEITISQSREKLKYSIEGDFSHLVRVMNNLLCNALKFTPVGGRVDILVQSQGPDVVVRVRDNGQGIQSDFLPHIFEAFRQENSSSTRSHGGLGLGLAISKHIVEQHAGKIYATSSGKNGGAEITVHLPQLQELVQDKTALARQAIDKSQPLAGFQILLVEDSEDLRTLLSYFLKEKGATVLEVDSAKAALEVLAEMNPDLVLSDIGMPGEDGYSLMVKIRNLGSSVPAIALTAYASEEDRKKALQAGFDSHLTKPISAADLVANVQRLLFREMSTLPDCKTQTMTM